MKTQAYFCRLGDNQPRKTKPDSLFKLFDVTCVKCNNERLKVIYESDEENGGAVYLFCPTCRSREKLPL